MKPEMNELDLNELEQVNAGCIWRIAGVTIVAAVDYGLGRLSAYQAKKGK